MSVLLSIKEIQVVEMDHFQQKQQNFTKWDGSIWNSVEKQISFFQKKVTDCMLRLGDISKKIIEDFKVQPTLEGQVILGEQFYVEMIRPFCVNKGYLPKKPPTPEEVQDIRFDQQQQRRQDLQPIKEEKKAGKKAGKPGAKGAKNDEKMKMQIVKANFQKDIDILLKSHSMERMQIQFGLKHKKLQLKLITFFYVAYFIRKNKVNLEIDQSQIFELVNILIKTVRTFSHFQGPSFSDSSAKIQLSPTLILDIKLCIKSLKEYYHYTNKTVMIKYPKLVYYTNYDKFFPTLDVKPYSSQIQFIQAVKSAFNEKGNIVRPTVVFYRTMIGSGKTSASLALTQLLHESKLLDAKNNNLQVMYSCLISSVRVQVGRYCYNKGQKFALSAMEPSIKDQNYFYPRIINSWSCRNEKVVDLIISDLHCAYEMLDHRKLTPEQQDIMNNQQKNRKNVVNRGKLERQNIVLFIDEPTAFCKSTQSSATRKLFDILATCPPKLIILASATMPSVQELPSTIQLIRRKNPDLQVLEVNSKQFQIGCQYCSFKGQVIFPHTGLKSREELNNIIDILKKNAFLLKLYTGPSLFFLLKRCEQIGLKGLPQIDSLPEVKQDDITKATFRILQILSKQNDQVIKQVCSLAKDETIMDFKVDTAKNSDDQMFDFLGDENQEVEQQEQIQEKQDYVNFKRMVKGDAYKFLGGCLIGAAKPIQFAHKMFQKWVRKIKPIKRLKEKYDKSVEELQKEIRALEEDTEMREQKKSQLISKIQTEKQPKLQFPDHRKINTIEHYTKYCKNKEASHKSMLIRPVPIESSNLIELIEEVDDFMLKLLFCGVAVYTQRGLSPKYLDKVEELASQNFLAYIVTDQSLCYGTNFPISNVILTDELVQNLNMNEMFQLIGRAGRVGQSWAARAFLQPKGLKKLNDYIHKPENQINDQGKIFEDIAKEHLNNPKLRLKNNMCEVRYLNDKPSSDYVELQVQKKDQEPHFIRKLVVVPFINTQQGVKYLCQKAYQNFSYYNFPWTNLGYEDLPTTLNENGQSIIDLSIFYKGFKQYLLAVADNALKRLLTIQLNDELKDFKIINHFKPKVYEPFYNHESNTLTILIQCKQDQRDLRIDSYSFQEIIGIPVQLDSLFKDKIQALIRESTPIVEKFRLSPTSVIQQDLKRCIQKSNELLSNQRALFYKEMIESRLAQSSREYKTRLQNVFDKQDLKDLTSIPQLISISQQTDAPNFKDPLFHVFPLIRNIWKTIESKAEELK